MCCAYCAIEGMKFPYLHCKLNDALHRRIFLWRNDTSLDAFARKVANVRCAHKQRRRGPWLNRIFPTSHDKCGHCLCSQR